MKNLLGVLLTCFLLSATAHAQDTRNSRELNARSAEKKSAMNETVEIYTMVNLTFEDDKMMIQPSKSEGKFGNKYSSRTYPEIDRLTKADLSAEGEIDFLNTMGENNWKLITVIVNTEGKKTMKSMYFSKSVPTAQARAASREETTPSSRTTPATRTAPAER